MEEMEQAEGGQGKDPQDMMKMALDMLAGLSDAMQQSGAPKEAVDMVVKGAQMVQQGLQMAAGGAQPAQQTSEMAGGNPDAQPLR